MQILYIPPIKLHFGVGKLIRFKSLAKNLIDEQDCRVQFCSKYKIYPEIVKYWNGISGFEFAWTKKKLLESNLP